jgi:hypothetical protein
VFTLKQAVNLRGVRKKVSRSGEVKCATTASPESFAELRGQCIQTKFDLLTISPPAHKERSELFKYHYGR